MLPEERFDALLTEFAGRPGVGLPGEPGTRGFGSTALKVDGSIFAMLVRGSLVVKLPAPRVADLIAAGGGVAFDAGKGRPMKEWLVVADDDHPTWLALSGEAYRYVGSLPPRRPRGRR
jgi:hypothetical protein